MDKILDFCGMMVVGMVIILGCYYCTIYMNYLELYNR